MSDASSSFTFTGGVSPRLAERRAGCCEGQGTLSDEPNTREGTPSPAMGVFRWSGR